MSRKWDLVIGAVAIIIIAAAVFQSVTGYNQAIETFFDAEVVTDTPEQFQVNATPPHTSASSSNLAKGVFGFIYIMLTIGLIFFAILVMLSDFLYHRWRPATGSQQKAEKRFA